jgi:hypothetical protein
MDKKSTAESKRYDQYGIGKATIPFTVKVKPRSVMGDYIALHGLVPQNELPLNLRHQIPEDEIWIREDVYDDPERRLKILQGHERFEISLMETKRLSYKQAHEKAERHEKLYKIKELENIEKDLIVQTEEPERTVGLTAQNRPKQTGLNSKSDEKKRH